ncbi:protein kinase [Kitasatospora sp. NPDC049285]|uniref:protein kinase domain-containing protein n=1 Tax=Kitasatospora sp. NPDC049285 TaxID=3157096 RepID=UPI003418C01B
MIGRAMNGRYELGEILGVGGMATVYRGIDRQLGRPVAVKVLNGGLADDPRFAERFAREAQHAALLVHPRIVTVFDSGVDQGAPYLVMELVHGRALGHLIAEQGALPVERAVGIAAAVLDALSAAHAQGLVHRDIKPGNIMITHDGGVKVVDFGIARAGSSSGQQLTQTATVLGTAAYLSPEQATAAELDGRSDLYAVGCVLVEMLTGAPPFTADTPVAIAFKHVTEYPAPVSLQRPDVSPALDAAIMRLLAKNPADRPADAASAAAELLAAVPSVPADRAAALLGSATQVLPPVAAPPQPYTEQHRTSVLPPLPSMAAMDSDGYHDEEPRRSRNPLVYGGIGAAVIVCVAAVAAFSFSGNGGTPKTQHTAAPPVASSSAPEPSTAAPSPSLSPSSRPSATPKLSVAGQLAQLRADVAQANFARDRDRQDDLTKLLDQAAQAVGDKQPDEAESALKDAQRLIRDLQKRHAVEGGVLTGWLNRVTALTAVVHAQAQQN